MSLRLVLLGPPGSGKGTLAELIEQHLTITHLSTGDLFRQEIKRGSALGKTVSRYVTEGRLVPDELVVRVMTRRLSASQLTRGFVLDGFPRTVGQATGLQTFLAGKRRMLTGVVYLVCPISLSIDRLGGRLVCSTCGLIYHVRNKPPKRAGFCDQCHGRLVVRKDDARGTIAKRLRIDKAEAAPLLMYYRRQGLLHRLNGVGTGPEVFDRARRLFRTLGWLPQDSTTCGSRQHTSSCCEELP